MAIISIQSSKGCFTILFYGKQASGLRNTGYKTQQKRQFLRSYLEHSRLQAPRAGS